jgi:DNA-directed RNA polymerase subunit omega
LEVSEVTSNFGNIDSKFRYIIVAAKRTRQLQAGSQPMVNTQSRKFTRIAQEEVASGLVKYDIETVSKAVPKKRASKEGKGH